MDVAINTRYRGRAGVSSVEPPPVWGKGETMSTRIRRRALVAIGASCIGVALVLGAGPALSLAPSTFESADGNTPVNTAGNQDWDQLTTASLKANKADTPSGPNDESFTQGTKSDTPIPTVETGSIPPNKSDLTRFRIASETVNGEVFLYVAWNRSNTLGSANMNFEFNASSTLSSNNKTPVRTEGDVLITFDFANGGNHVDLGLARWAQSPCVANGGKLPDCWGNFLDLDAAGFADGAVSGDGRFGEAAINLTDAGVFASGSCTTIGSAYLSSRSSDSFTAALKDFIPPESVNISTCGSFQINKTAKHKDANSDPNLQASFDVIDSDDNVVQSVQTDAETGTVCVTGLAPGTYTVDETSGQTGYALDPDVESVTIAVGDTCAAKQVSFENVPLSKFTVSFESLVTGGTAANITCTGPDGDMDPDAGDTTDAYDDTSEAYGNLEPGVYTCTIDVDP